MKQLHCNESNKLLRGSLWNVHDMSSLFSDSSHKMAYREMPFLYPELGNNRPIEYVKLMRFFQVAIVG